jgi:hypothetical protein
MYQNNLDDYWNLEREEWLKNRRLWAGESPNDFELWEQVKARRIASEMPLGERDMKENLEAKKEKAKIEAIVNEAQEKSSVQINAAIIGAGIGFGLGGPMGAIIGAFVVKSYAK